MDISNREKQRERYQILIKRKEMEEAVERKEGIGR